VARPYDAGASGDAGGTTDSPSSANDAPSEASSYDAPSNVDANGVDAAVEASPAAEAGAVEGGGADAGSFYDTPCSATSMTCSGTPLICQAFSFGGGAITGYACSMTCTTTPDCGASNDPAVHCLPFTTASFCVLTCDPNSATSCPSPLKCTADQGQPIGICVSF
jgi:hypothetical protein